MKTTLSFSLFLFLCVLPLPAQITQPNNVIRPGDVIVKQQVVYKDPGRTGEGVLWDFSKLEAINPEYKLSYSAPHLRRDSLYVLGKDTFRLQEVAENELIVGREHKTNYFYRIRDNALYCMGHQNPTALMQYIAPIPVVAYPMDYQQKINRDYRSECLYSQQVPMFTHGWQCFAGAFLNAGNLFPSAFLSITSALKKTGCCCGLNCVMPSGKSERPAKFTGI
jgi:hypothetical protein